MRVPDWEKYLKEVLSHVKFKYDHNPIYVELSNHMEDRYEDFITNGMDKEQGQKEVITCMGDADILGEELNKVHSPLVGWIWLSLRNLLIILILINLFPVFSLITSAFISVFETYKDKEDSPLVYTIDIGYKEKVYDTTYIIDKILYYEDNTMEIRYATWTNPFSDSIKWSLSISPEIYMGETQLPRGGKGWKSGSYYGRGQEFREDVPLDATKIIIPLIYNNKEISIDLTEGRMMANES